LLIALLSIPLPFSSKLPVPIDAQINKIKANMSSAKLYVSSDVVDRLTRPITSSGSAEDLSQHQYQQRFDSSSPSGRSSRPGVMNIQSFLGSLQGSVVKEDPSGAGIQQSPQQLSSDEKRKRQLKFESFLNRQKAIMKRKEEQIQQVQ